MTRKHNQPLEPIAAPWAAPAQLFVVQNIKKEAQSENEI